MYSIMQFALKDLICKSVRTNDFYICKNCIGVTKEIQKAE